MFVTWSRTIASGFAVLSLALASQTVACVVNHGDKLLLASPGLDPDVFLWDSETRLADYIRGDYDTETVLKHTTLIRPGTAAMVLDCKDSVATPPFSNTGIDAVAVKLTSGTTKGRHGWISAEDARRPDGKPLVRSTP